MTLAGFVLASAVFATSAGSYAALRRAGRNRLGASFGATLLLGVLAAITLVMFRIFQQNEWPIDVFAYVVAGGVALAAFHLWRRHD